MVTVLTKHLVLSQALHPFSHQDKQHYDCHYSNDQIESQKSEVTYLGVTQQGNQGEELNLAVCLSSLPLFHTLRSNKDRVADLQLLLRLH